MLPERMTWDEMVELYPDKWVMLRDVEFEDEYRANIKSAVVAQVLSDDIASDVRLKSDRQGHHYLFRRTTEYDGFMGAAIEFYMPPVRKTWDEIIKNVPSGMWVALSDVIFEEDGVTVKSADPETVIENEHIQQCMLENERYKFNLTYRQVP